MQYNAGTGAGNFSRQRMKRRMKDKVRIADLPSAPVSEKEVLNIRERRKIETGLRKWEVIKEAQRLKRAGKNYF